MSRKKDKQGCGRKIIGTILMLAMTFVGMSQNGSAVNCPAGSVNEGKGSESLADCNLPATPPGSSDLMGTINTIINVVLGVLGLLAVVMIVYGGFMYMTAAGDASKVKKAKDTIMYGVIGLIIALLAFAIVNFVLKSVFTSSAPTETKNNTGGPNATGVAQ